MARTYYLLTLNDTFGGGANDADQFSKSVGETVETPSSASVTLAASQTADSHGPSELGIPNVTTGWNGTWTVRLLPTVADANVMISIAIQRLSAAGAVLNTSAFTAEQGALVTVMTFTPSVSFGSTFDATDRFRIVYRFRNSHTHTGRGCTIATGTADADIVAPFAAGATIVDAAAAFAGAGVLGAAAKLTSLAAASMAGVATLTANAAEPNVAPNTPSVTDAQQSGDNLTLTSSAFSDPNAGDTHQASRWRIYSV